MNKERKELVNCLGKQVYYDTGDGLTSDTGIIFAINVKNGLMLLGILKEENSKLPAYKVEVIKNRITNFNPTNVLDEVSVLKYKNKIVDFYSCYKEEIKLGKDMLLFNLKSRYDDPEIVNLKEDMLFESMDDTDIDEFLTSMPI